MTAAAAAASPPKGGDGGEGRNDAARPAGKRRIICLDFEAVERKNEGKKERRKGRRKSERKDGETASDAAPDAARITEAGCESVSEDIERAILNPIQLNREVFFKKMGKM